MNNEADFAEERGSIDLGGWNAAIAIVIDGLGSATFEKWLIEALGLLAEFDDAVIFAYRKGRKPLALYHTFQPHQREILVDRYREGPYFLDPFYQACHNGTEPGVHRLRDLSPNRFRQTEYFRSFYNLAGISEEVCFILPPCGEARVVVSLMRMLPRKAFSKAELGWLAEAVPVVNALGTRAWKNLSGHETEPPSDGQSSVDVEVLYRSFRSDVLSPRERQVAAMVLRGYSSAAIGKELSIAEATVKANRRSIHAKLGISSQAELFATFIRHIPFFANYSSEADKAEGPGR